MRKQKMFTIGFLRCLRNVPKIWSKTVKGSSYVPML